MTKKIFINSFLLGAAVLLMCTTIFFTIQYSQTMRETYEALQGEAPGWNVVRFGGYPLGWIKGSGGQLKNHYPKGLRKDGILTEPG